MSLKPLPIYSCGPTFTPLVQMLVRQYLNRAEHRNQHNSYTTRVDVELTQIGEPVLCISADLFPKPLFPQPHSRERLKVALAATQTADGAPAVALWFFQDDNKIGERTYTVNGLFDAQTHIDLYFEYSRLEEEPPKPS